MADFSVYLLNKRGQLPRHAQPVSPDEYGFVVVEEFDKWLLRVDSPTEAIYIEFANEYLPLEQSASLGGFVWPKGRTNDQQKLLRRGTTGYLYFYQPDKNGGYRRLSPAISCLVASLSQEDYILLLDRLSELAISFQSPKRALIEGALPTETSENGLQIDLPVIKEALAWLKFFEIFRQQWPQIAQNPATDTKRVPQRVRVDAPAVRRSGSLAMRQLVRRPGRSHLWIPVLQEETNTPENRFIAFALRTLAAQAQGRKRAIEKQIERLDPQNPENITKPQVGLDAQRLWSEGRQAASKTIQYFTKLAQRLIEAQNWANRQLKKSFVSPIPATSPPQHPSLRLTRSPGYGAVYAAYRRIGDKLMVKLDPVHRGLAERRVKPSSELYELWLFLETYTLLVEYFGFRPLDNEPIAHLELKNNHLHLAQNFPFTLEMRPLNALDDHYQLRLTYQSEQQHRACESAKSCFSELICAHLPCYNPTTHFRRPDLVIETEYKGKKMKFALDAKYRRYAVQPYYGNKYGLQTLFDLDLLDVAKSKYLHGLELDACFIVHSDPNPNYTYLGDVPYRIPPHREKALLADDTQTFPAAHRYGAIFASPKDTTTLIRLLKCFLMYHAEWYDICWLCRRKMLVVTKERRDKRAPNGVVYYFQCQECRHFWMKSHCQSSHGEHTLIKLGADSFHRTKPNKPWHCECPACGDELDR